MLRKVICSIGTFASIIGLAFASQIPIPFKIGIVLIGIASFGFLLFGDIKDSHRNERICHSEDEIKQAMKELVKTQAKVCIMSRDLSWVDSEIEACIKDKKDDIKFFVQKETELTKRIQTYGGEVLYYGALGFEPKTRFTVIGYNREAPQVAIASTKHSVRSPKRVDHTIYETNGESSEDKALTSLSLDMIQLCNLVLKRGIEHAADATKIIE